jgi:hypothetical protein
VKCARLLQPTELLLVSLVTYILAMYTYVILRLSFTTYISSIAASDYLHLWPLDLRRIQYYTCLLPVAPIGAPVLHTYTAYPSSIGLYWSSRDP